MGRASSLVERFEMKNVHEKSQKSSAVYRICCNLTVFRSAFSNKFQQQEVHEKLWAFRILIESKHVWNEKWEKIAFIKWQRFFVCGFYWWMVLNKL